jgi:Uma2 family endonuclease
MQQMTSRLHRQSIASVQLGQSRWHIFVSILTTLTVPAALHLTEAAFHDLCRANPDLKFERTAAGDLIVMSPTGGETGNQNFELYLDLGLWNRQTNLGVAFDSSTGFKLPNGADRSPDLAWVQIARWQALTPDQRRRFPPIAPDFVMELWSETDNLETLRAKMQEYLENGVRLAWLINPSDRQVEIYRQEQAIEIVKLPSILSGEPVLPGFELDLSRIF